MFARNSRSLVVRLNNGGSDTLTESCEGAVNFMVIEMGVGPLLQLPLMVKVPSFAGGKEGFKTRNRPSQIAVQAEVGFEEGYQNAGLFFCFCQKR